MFGMRRSHVMIMLLGVALAVSLGSASAWAQGAISLQPGQELKRGETFANGGFSLNLQEDGNLVLYGPNGQPLWASWTPGTAAARVIMQADGNLVLYDGANRPIWASQTAMSVPNSRDLAPANGNARLELDQSGNLRIVAPSGQVLWHPLGTSVLAAGNDLKTGDLLQNAKFTLLFQNNGDLVLYEIVNEQWQPRWSSKTGGKGGARAAMQADGNFVIYTAAQQAVWSTQTGDNPGAELRVTEQRTAQITLNNKVLWENGQKK